MSYFIYILECNDGSLYTGITTDVAKRLAEHTIVPLRVQSIQKLGVRWSFYMKKHQVIEAVLQSVNMLSKNFQE